MWVNHGDFLSIIRSVFQQHVLGTKQFSWCKNLQQLKGPLRRLNSNHFSHIFFRVARATKELEEAQLSLQNLPHDQSLQSQISLMWKQTLFLKEAERSFYHQQAKCTYLKLSDRCTKIFHAIVKHNFITAISRVDASMTTSTNQVAEEFI